VSTSDERNGVGRSKREKELTFTKLEHRREEGKCGRTFFGPDLLFVHTWSTQQEIRIGGGNIQRSPT
jgi:hypothetical protein